METLTRIQCDFCSAFIDEAWYYRHREFKYIASGRLVDAAGGEAAACTDCKRFVDARDSSSLLSRAFLLNPEQRAAIGAIRLLHEGILNHLTGGVRHVRLGDLVPKPDRFFVTHCPKCSRRRNLDRAEARERSIVYKCECGTEVSVGPIGWD